MSNKQRTFIFPAASPLDFLNTWGSQAKAFGDNGNSVTLLGGNIIKMLFAGSYGATAFKTLNSGKEVSVKTPKTKKEWLEYLKSCNIGSKEVQYKAVNLMERAGFIDYAANKHYKKDGSRMTRDHARRQYIALMLQDNRFLTKGMAFLRSVLTTYYAAMPSQICDKGLRPRIKGLKWFSESAKVCRRFVNKVIVLLTDIEDQYRIRVVIIK